MNGRGDMGCGRTDGNFYELRRWSESDWKAARDLIEAQNAKDKAQR